MRADWSADPDKHLGRLAKWIEAESVSGSVAYDLRKIADVYDSWPAGIVEDAIQRDVLSVLQGKQPRGASSIREIASLVQAHVKGADSLRGLANDLLVAKAIGAASADFPAGAVSQ